MTVRRFGVNPRAEGPAGSTPGWTALSWCRLWRNSLFVEDVSTQRHAFVADSIGVSFDDCLDLLRPFPTESALGAHWPPNDIEQVLKRPRRDGTRRVIRHGGSANIVLGQQRHASVSAGIADGHPRTVDEEPHCGTCAAAKGAAIVISHLCRAPVRSTTLPITGGARKRPVRLQRPVRRRSRRRRDGGEPLDLLLQAMRSRDVEPKRQLQCGSAKGGERSPHRRRRGWSPPMRSIRLRGSPACEQLRALHCHTPSEAVAAVEA
jgi:hypothetical protein